MESFLKAENGGKNICALYAHNDDMAVGAIQAIKEAGLKPGTDILVVSIDAVPDIFKAMSLRPELMEKVLDLSERGHFSDGYLDRRTKERIATFVSALNGSPYCLGSHAGGLRTLGSPSSQVAALARADLAGAGLPVREQALLEFVRGLTLKPGQVTDADVARLRQHGWSDEQVFEAAFDAALFAFFNRVASAYGLDSPPDGWEPSQANGAGNRRPHSAASGLP